MKFIDTHTHLYLEDFNDDIDAVISRSLEAGIKKFLLPNIDSTTINAMNSLAEKYPKNLFPMMGLHPTSVKEDFESELQRVEKELDTGRYIAVGEIGIDLYWDKTFASEQKTALNFQLDLALKYNLPVVIHMRNSFDEIMEVLSNYKNKGLRGVFHCFTGTIEQARRIVDFGFLLGIGGVLTFKNSGLDKVVFAIEPEAIILETDSPYLAPTPHRGRRNDSSYIPLIAGELASIKSISLEDIARITTTNAENLFKLKP